MRPARLGPMRVRVLPHGGYTPQSVHQCASNGSELNLRVSNWLSRRIHGNVFSTADTISALVERVSAVSITQLRARFTTVRTNER